MFKIAEKLVGIRRVDGVHPGGIIPIPKGINIYSYTPIIQRFPDGIPITQIDFHALEGTLLKLDLLGHDTLSFLKYLSDATGIDPLTIPTDDDKILSLFSGIEALDIKSSQIGGVEVGTLGVPEFGYYRARKKLELLRPKRLSDVIRIVGMLHDGWESDPFKLIRDEGILISECIGTRDDIMLYLIDRGIDCKTAYWKQFVLKRMLDYKNL